MFSPREKGMLLIGGYFAAGVLAGAAWSYYTGMKKYWKECRTQEMYEKEYNALLWKEEHSPETWNKDKNNRLKELQWLAGNVPKKPTVLGAFEEYWFKEA